MLALKSGGFFKPKKNKKEEIYWEDAVKLFDEKGDIIIFDGKHFTQNNKRVYSYKGDFAFSKLYKICEKRISVNIKNDKQKNVVIN